MYSASHILGFVSICLFAQAQLTQMPDVNAPEERRPPPWEPPGRVYFTKDQVLRAVERAKERLKARKEEEFLRWSENGRTDPPSPHGAMAALFNKPTPDALERANVSHLYEMASEELFRISTNRVRRQLGGDLIDFGPNSVFEDNSLNNNFGQFQNSDIIEVIPPPPSLQKCGLTEPSVCDPTSPFRTFSGVCNNLARPNLGRSLTPYTRLLPAAYQDRVSVPRVTGISGRPLPSPRIISTLVHRDVSHLSSRFSLMLMQFGQFLDHDISFTPNHRSFSASIPDCASCDSSRHPECMPIPVPINDPFHPPPNNGRPKCFAFIRSLPGQLNFGPREQVNQNSAFIDASQVYGEHICRTTSLRAPGGRMNATFFPPMGPNSRARELLPQVTSNCRGTCFAAGDGRASEQPGLTIMHTIFMREHNRLADALHQINPRWSEETVFHQARKIVAAQVQHIAFSEFLPRILGPDNVAKNNLGLLSDGYYNGYNASCDPRVYNEFVAAAFRFGHSLVRPHLPRVGARWEPLTPPLLLRENFFDSSSLMNPRMMDELIRGLLASPTEDADRFISGEVTNHLFEARRNPFSGLDIAALNIQRGRDHGLQSYNEYRAMCGLKKAIVWEDLLGEMTVEAAETLRGVYGNVDDVDLYPGGASESALPGALVGPTFSCIIAMQFRKFRDCDRFWYETGSQVERFSPAQLAELRKTSLSKIICNNMDVPIDIQLAAFDLPNGSTNPRVDCKTLNGIDLNAWREFGVQGRALNSGPGSFCQFNERVVRIGESQLVLPCTSCQCTITGMRCKSIRVTDCSALISRVGLAAMRRDVVCMAQCRRILSNEPSGPPGPPLATAPLLGRPPGPPGPPAPEEGGILNNLSLKGMRPLFNRLLGFLG